MRGFMPVYYLYFKMVSEMEELLPEDGDIDSAREIIKKVES